MATPPEDSGDITNSSANLQVYANVASLEENEFRIFLEEVTSQDRKKADKSAIAQAAQILLRKEEDALKEESGSGEDVQEYLSACHKRKRLLKGKDHGEHSSSAAARTSTGGSLGSLQDLTETNIPETSSAAGTKSGGSCGNLSRGSFKTQAPIKQRGKRLKVGRASTSIREGGSLQNLSKTEAASNEAKKLHKSGSLSQVFTDVGGARLKNRRQKTSSESSGCKNGRKSEEKDAGSDGECSEIPYRPLVTSPMPSASEVDDKEGVGKSWNRDRMSDVPSGESTEEDGESLHCIARSKLSDATVPMNGTETELISVVTHTAHKDNSLPPIIIANDVDKKIKFCLDSTVENSLESGKPAISLIPSYVEVSDLFSAGKRLNYKNVKNENSEKIQGDRRIFDTMTEILPRYRHFHYLQKSSLDSQPIKESNLNVINSLKTSYDDVGITHRSNGYSNGSTKEYNYHRMKAKCDKKKILRKKNEIPIEETPGYVGDAPFSEILTFINDIPEGKNSNQKGKKKHKNKKEEIKDDREISKKKKNGERFSNNISALTKTTDGVENIDSDWKKSKRGSLRGTSSVEDLVSKSKQKNADLFVKKQVAVEDGDLLHLVNKFDSTAIASEFSHDFYRVGDALLNDSVIQENGEFELVNRKKSRKNRIQSVPEKVETVGNKINNNSFHNQKLCSLPVNADKQLATRPSMNFQEGLMFDGDVIFNKWPSNKGSSCDRIGHTTSAPHSEGSESDGDDSVHSMPVKSTTPKHELCDHSQSSDSTPQASYANIAKLSSKKRLERIKNTDSDNSSQPELGKTQVIMSDFPPLPEIFYYDQNPSEFYSPADLTTSTTVRRNSLTNECLSKQNVIADNSVAPVIILSKQDENPKSLNSELGKSQKYCIQRDNPCELKNNLKPSKANSRREVSANQVKTNKNPKGNCATEPAVIFRTKTGMPESMKDIEFGLGVGLLEMIPPALSNDTKSYSEQIVPHTETSHSKKAITKEKSVANMFRKMFVPPKDEVFPNHEETYNLLSKSWANTMKMMEEEPENVVVWKCPKPDSPT